MSTVTMIECDNPRCSNVGQPEWLPPPRSRKQPTGPYGWIDVTGMIIGAGPNVNICVCSVECLQPAWKAALERERRVEWGED